MKKMRLMYFYKRPFMKVTHTVLRWCSQGRHTPTDCTRSTLSSHHSFHIHIGAHITASSAKSEPYLPLYKTVILSALAREILQFSTNPWSRSHQFRELSSYPGYFRKPHWKSMRLLEISRVTWQVWSIHFGINKLTVASEMLQPEKNSCHIFFFFHFDSNFTKICSKMSNEEWAILPNL